MEELAIVLCVTVVCAFIAWGLESWYTTAPIERLRLSDAPRDSGILSGAQIVKNIRPK